MTESSIFIVGCPRSGTTLLRDLLCSHPHLVFPPESNFIPVFYRAFGDPGSDREAVLLARRILNLVWVRSWELDLDPADFREDWTIRNRRNGSVHRKNGRGSLRIRSSLVRDSVMNRVKSTLRVLLPARIGLPTFLLQAGNP